MIPVEAGRTGPLARLGPVAARRSADQEAVNQFDQAIAVPPVSPVDAVSLTRELRERFAHPGANLQALQDYVHERVPGNRARATALQAVWVQVSGTQGDAHLCGLVRTELGRLITLNGMVQNLLSNKFKLEIES